MRYFYILAFSKVIHAYKLKYYDAYNNTALHKWAMHVTRRQKVL